MSAGKTPNLASDKLPPSIFVNVVFGASQYSTSEQLISVWKYDRPSLESAQDKDKIGHKMRLELKVSRTIVSQNVGNAII